MHKTIIHMHNFSIQDKTVTFQYENVVLQVGISQRSLINTPVLRLRTTSYKSNKLSLLAMIKKYMQAIYIGPSTLFSNNNISIL